MLSCYVEEIWGRIWAKWIWVLSVEKMVWRCGEMSREGKYERLWAWRCTIRDLEKQFGFDVKNHSCPADVETISLGSQGQAFCQRDQDKCIAH